MFTGTHAMPRNIPDVKCTKNGPNLSIQIIGEKQMAWLTFAREWYRSASAAPLSRVNVIPGPVLILASYSSGEGIESTREVRSLLYIRDAATAEPQVSSSKA